MHESAFACESEKNKQNELSRTSFSVAAQAFAAHSQIDKEGKIEFRFGRLALPRYPAGD